MPPQEQQTQEQMTPTAEATEATKTLQKKIEGTRLQRAFKVETREIDEEARTVELAFSSEDPYERWFGVEILGHKPGEVMLDRLNNAGAVLKDHDRYQQTGVVEEARIDQDGRGRAKVRFSKNNPVAEQEFRDITDGIRQHVSVGYIVHEMVLEKETDEGPNTYRVTKWEPLEISIVSVPADATVGVGRDDERGKNADVVNKNEEKKQMPVEQTEENKPATPAVDTAKIREDALALERDRVREINGVAAKYPQFREEADSFINDGKPADEFRKRILEKMTGAPLKEAVEDPEIGMSQKEIKEYSLVRAINAAITGDWSKAGLEKEASLAVAQRYKKDPNGFFMPMDIASRSLQEARGLNSSQVRDLSVGTATAGGHTVATNLLASSFIDLLRNRMMVIAMGARTLSGLVGDVAIPRQTGGGTAYWVTEGSTLTESQQAFDQVALTPKTVGAYTEMTRKLLQQSTIDIEAFVREDLATVLALAIDLAAINGDSANNQPVGILNTSGIGSVAGGTNGAQPDWGNIVDLETAVDIDNALVGSLGYLTNAKVRGTLKQTEKATNTAQFVWDNTNDPAFGMMNGYRAGVSNQVPSDLDKGTSTGVCSAIIFGNFADLIFGLWGALDILVNPYALDTSGGVRITALQDVDVAVRHAESFAAMQDALTLQ